MVLIQDYKLASQEHSIINFWFNLRIKSDMRFELIDELDLHDLQTKLHLLTAEKLCSLHLYFFLLLLFFTIWVLVCYLLQIIWMKVSRFELLNHNFYLLKLFFTNNNFFRFSSICFLFSEIRSYSIAFQASIIFQ